MEVPDALVRRCLSPRVLGLILLPTEKCNFRCTYCYEDFALGRMTSGVVLGVKQLLSVRAPRLDLLSLGWFGGEPLLALDIVEDVQRHAQRLAREYPDLRVNSNMTTNAWKLSPAVFGRLLALGVNEYQISFDGPPEHHDRRRVRAGGRPSFDLIWSNVLAMRERSDPFQVHLRLHVDRENLEAMFAFVELCQETFRGDERFKIFLKPLGHYGGSNGQHVPILGSDEEWRRYAELQAHAARSSTQPVLGAAVAPSPGHGEVCYAAHGNQFVVRSDGRLCKCTIILDDPRNQVGRLHEDGTVEISAPAMEPWMRGLWSGRRSELLCPLQGFPEPAVAASA
ncbi:MAG: radical SAM protein [Planctomycetota bacterium]